MRSMQFIYVKYLPNADIYCMPIKNIFGLLVRIDTSKLSACPQETSDILIITHPVQHGKAYMQKMNH